MTEGSYSLSDIASIMNRNGDGLFGGNGSGFIILILFLLMMGGGAWGNNAYGAVAQGMATRSDIQDGFNTNRIDNSISALRDNISASTYAINNSIKDGFATSTLAMANGFNSVNSGINNLGYQMQNCCCDLKSAIHAEGEATRALITENEIQKLRTDLQSAQLTLANTVQTQNILGSLGTFYTNPAYSPNTCGCNNY